MTTLENLIRTLKQSQDARVHSWEKRKDMIDEEFLKHHKFDCHLGLKKAILDCQVDDSDYFTQIEILLAYARSQ